MAGNALGILGPFFETSLRRGSSTFNLPRAKAGVGYGCDEVNERPAHSQVARTEGKGIRCRSCRFCVSLRGGAKCDEHCPIRTTWLLFSYTEVLVIVEVSVPGTVFVVVAVTARSKVRIWHSL